MSKAYWNMIYYSVMLFGINEVAPRTTFLLMFVSVTMLISAMVNANLFGTMAVLVQEMNRKSVQFQEEIDIANTALMNLKVPKELQRKIKDYILFT